MRRRGSSGPRASRANPSSSTISVLSTRLATRPWPAVSGVALALVLSVPGAGGRSKALWRVRFAPSYWREADLLKWVGGWG
eukprot:4623121-Alexandrium_andersonii.AAC.1